MEESVKSEGSGGVDEEEEEDDGFEEEGGEAAKELLAEVLAESVAELLGEKRTKTARSHKTGITASKDLQTCMNIISPFYNAYFKTEIIASMDETDRQMKQRTRNISSSLTYLGGMYGRTDTDNLNT